MELCIERLLKSGVSPRQIAWMGFDDERFDQMQTSDFNSILEAYMEMFPDIPIKDVYFFFDEIQRIEGWELFVMRLSKHYSKLIVTAHNVHNAFVNHDFAARHAESVEL